MLGFSSQVCLCLGDVVRLELLSVPVPWGCVMGYRGWLCPNAVLIWATTGAGSLLCWRLQGPGVIPVMKAAQTTCALRTFGPFIVTPRSGPRSPPVWLGILGTCPLVGSSQERRGRLVARRARGRGPQALSPMPDQRCMI